jgi:hypothetical protein
VVQSKFGAYGWRLVAQDPELMGSYLPISIKHEPTRKVVSYEISPLFNCSENPSPLTELSYFELISAACGFDSSGSIHSLPPYRAWLEPTSMESALEDFKFWFDRPNSTLCIYSATATGEYKFTVHIEF